MKGIRNLFGKFILLKTLLLTFSLLLMPAGFAADAPAATVAVGQQVDINTADAETLALALDGIGAAKAQEIVEYREKHGAFKSVDQLTDVKGIGKATLERNRARILIKNE